MWCSRLRCTSPIGLSKNPQRSGNLSSAGVWCQWSSQRAQWHYGWFHPGAPTQTNAERNESRQLANPWIFFMNNRVERHKCSECPPVCWSHRRGCRSPPGSRKSQRIPPHSGSHRSKPLGLWAGRSGRFRRVSPPNPQTSSCHSSGAYSSCNAVQHTHFNAF